MASTCRGRATSASAMAGPSVVKQLSFEIERGECLGVIGPERRRQDTTIRMCLGLTAPTAARSPPRPVRCRADAAAIKAQLGVVSQFDTLDPTFPARRTCVYGRLLRHEGRADPRAHPSPAGISPRCRNKADAKPGELSAACAGAFPGAGAGERPARLHARRADHRPRSAGPPT